MPKVICIKCKEIGYTASPKYVRCECGGKLVTVIDDPDELKKGGNKMKVLLILNREKAGGLMVVVNAHTLPLRKKVVSLLEENKGREAFDLLVNKAEVEYYFVPGEKTDIKPAITLIEDLL